MDQGQFEGTYNEVAGKVEKAAGDLSGDTRTQAQGLADQATGKFQKTYGRARDMMDDAVGQARQAAVAAQEQAGTLGEAVEATVHERPLLALAAAGAIGYVLAFLIHRK